jgi:K+-sensing histidine kinase KdpD
MNPTGIGLGLTICNNILHQMGTELKVYSKINKGSTFFFEIKMPSKNNS